MNECFYWKKGCNRFLTPPGNSFYLAGKHAELLLEAF